MYNEENLLKNIQEKISKMREEALNYKKNSNNISIPNYKKVDPHLICNRNIDSLTGDNNGLKDLKYFSMEDNSEKMKIKKIKYKKNEVLSLSDNFKINNIIIINIIVICLIIRIIKMIILKLKNWQKI
jgi:hypothetical protein